jgi:hypothetical protein
MRPSLQSLFVLQPRGQCHGTRYLKEEVSISGDIVCAHLSKFAFASKLGGVFLSLSISLSPLCATEHNDIQLVFAVMVTVLNLPLRLCQFNLSLSLNAI